LYSTEDGGVTVDGYFQNETFWLTQKTMSKLFDVESNNITYHLQEIYKTEELDRLSTTRNFRVVQKEGTRSVGRDI
jgi:hypothetical protein